MNETQSNDDVEHEESWKSAQPKLRTDLRFYPQKSNGKLVVVVEDPIRSKYFRIGKSEYIFISQLDGQRNVEQAFELARDKVTKAGNEFELELESAKEICDFLSKSNLIRVVDEEALQTLADNQEKAKLATKFNPIFQKVPLFSPANWLERRNNVSRFIFSVKGLTIWLAVLSLAIYFVCQNWLEFYSSSQGILSGYGWIWMIVTWVLLKVVHEFGHASCCHRFGGNVREFGLAFICFFPVAYVDVSSSWKLSKKWQKMAIASAGIFIELFVAAVATIAWFCVDDPVIKSGLYNVIVVASITTIVFNINPLMKFDGYYVLADFVEVPTLYQRSQAGVKTFLQSIVFGSKVDREITAITAYGFAVLVWRILVCLGIFLTLSVFGEGIGIVFAVAALGLWLGPATLKFSKFLASGFRKDSLIDWKRFAFVSVSLFLILAGSGRIFFLPQQIVAHGVVESKDAQIVRADADGFVQSIFVEHGQQIKKGTPLVQLRNEQLETELAKLRLDEKRLQLEIQQFRAEGKTSRVISESEMLLKVMTEVEHKEEQVNALLVKATMDGVACIYDSETLNGKFVKEGDELLTVLDPNQKEITASISQHQLEGMGTDFQHHVADSGRFYCAETGASHVELQSLSPQATMSPASPLLCANVGGQLPVKPIANEGKNKDFELLEPHVTVFFALDEIQSQKLECGRRLRVRLNGSSTSTGYQIFKSMRRWLSNKISSVVSAQP